MLSDAAENPWKDAHVSKMGFIRSIGQLPWWRKISEHPAYDQFWQEQALDKVMAA